MVNYDINPLGGVDVGNVARNIRAGFAQRSEQEQAKQDRKQMQDAIRGSVKGDADSIETLYTLNPELGQQFEQRNADKLSQMGAEQAEASKQAETDWGLRWRQASTPEQFEALKQEALGNDLIDFDESDLEVGERETNLGVNSMLFSHLGKDQYKQFFSGTGGGAGIGKASPKDFTVESLSTYEKTGNIGDLVRFSPKTVKVGGVEHQLDPETQKWKPIIDATTKELTEQSSALADIAADKKSRIDFAASKTKWKAGRLKFKSKIDSAKASQNILSATADQIKKHINGLTTKYGASLSSIPGTESRLLKNQLNTLKAHSAFSTLTDLKQGGGTLGAISGAELVLLESKLGALDQGGEASELIRVVDQIVGSNLSSIGRLENEFNATDAMYSGGFDDLQKREAVKKENEKTINWSDLE